MADIKATLATLAASKGELALKRLSLKVGVDVTKVVSGAMAVDSGLEAKIRAGIQQLGY